MEVPQLIGGFKQKFEKFVILYKETKSQNVVLKQRVTELEAELQIKDIELEELGKKLQTNELAKTFLASEGANKDAKLKINKIVREIDNCIALLNR